MKQRKPTNKDFTNAITQLGHQISNLTGYINGIAEVLNEYIEYGGDAENFFKKLEDGITKNKKPESVPNPDKLSE